MPRTLKITAMAVLAATCIAGTAGAHHSFAMFSMVKTASVSGTVKEWQWTNPHSWLELIVTKPDGTQTQYSFESRSIYLLTRAKVNRHTLMPGQAVTVTYNPLRNGENGGSLVSATGQDGTVLIGGRPGGPPGGGPGGPGGGTPAP